MINNEKLNRVLPLMFRMVKINARAKEDLRRKLFGGAGFADELADDELNFVSAAGDLAERENKKDGSNGKNK